MRAPLGIAVVFAGYTIGLWGYCLIRSYDVTFGQLFKSTWPGLQSSVTAPTGGHKLGTINNSTSTSDPGQIQSGLGA
jgi:hypothetical protein